MIYDNRLRQIENEADRDSNHGCTLAADDDGYLTMTRAEWRERAGWHVMLVRKSTMSVLQPGVFRLPTFADDSGPPDELVKVHVSELTEAAK